MAGNENSGNKNIVEYAKGHRFGDPGGADPAAAARKAKPWSMRRTVRRICETAMEQLAPGEKLTVERIGEMVFGHRPLTFGEMSALRRVLESIRGNPKFSQYVTEDIDGKLVERKVEAQVTLADIVNRSYELEEGEVLDALDERAGASSGED